jgi:hypothetical protein
MPSSCSIDPHGGNGGKQSDRFCRETGNLGDGGGFPVPLMPTISETGFFRRFSDLSRSIFLLIA